MQGYVDLLLCPPERTEATFCRVAGGDSGAWRPHPKAPAGPGPASETDGRPARHRQHHGHIIWNRVTSALDFGVSQPSDCSWATCRFRTPGRWQTNSRSTDLFAAGRTRRPLGTLGSPPRTLAMWERGERVPAGGVAVAVREWLEERCPRPCLGDSPSFGRIFAAYEVRSAHAEALRATISPHPLIPTSDMTSIHTSFHRFDSFDAFDRRSCI